MLTPHSLLQPAIDVEAKVDDGYLGMGIFAPVDMLSEDEVASVIDEMGNLLLNFR
jgi:hypothetical protein